MSETPSSNTPLIEPSPTDSATAKTTGRTPQQAPAAKHGKGTGIRHTLLMLLILGGIVAGGFILWRSLRETQQQLSASTESARQQLDTISRRTEQLEYQVGEALPGNIAALQNQQQALEETLGRLRNTVEGDSRAWVIEEIAALLEIANNRLRLEGDIASTLAALEAADRHLQRLKNPALFEVRRILADEINALRSVASPDITGIALTLGALIDNVDRLPLANGETPKEQTAAATGEKGWRGMLNDLWENLKSLVVIKRRGEADRPLLAPDERYFLRQNLRLTLESARIALLRRDSRTYQQSLRSAQQWITIYFDNGATASSLKELARFQQIDIAPSLPDISGSLNAMQSWLTQQRHKKTQAAAPGATQP